MQRSLSSRDLGGKKCWATLPSFFLTRLSSRRKAHLIITSTLLRKSTALVAFVRMTQITCYEKKTFHLAVTISNSYYCRSRSRRTSVRIGNCIGWNTGKRKMKGEHICVKPFENAKWSWHDSKGVGSGGQVGGAGRSYQISLERGTSRKVTTGTSSTRAERSILIHVLTRIHETHPGAVLHQLSMPRIDLHLPAPDEVAPL